MFHRSKKMLSFFLDPAVREVSAETPAGPIQQWELNRRRGLSGNEGERSMKRTSNKSGKAASQGATVWTLNIKLVFGIYANGPWAATIEIDSSATLEDLHLVIQRAVQFSDDHMYMFYVARTHRSRDRTAFEDEDGSLYETTLAELFPLPDDRKLFYWFDFGDDWIFSIGRTRTAPQIPGKGKKYPRLIGTRGNTPVQYPPCD
jgi:hypothetical protein